MGLPAAAWGWMLAIALLGIAIGIRVMPRQIWLANEYRYAPWSARRHYVAAAIAFGMLLHLGGFFAAFDINDDQHLIAGDPLITQLSWANLRALAATDFHGTFQPLTYVAAAFNWAVAGERYWGWYLFNWLFLIPVLYCVARLCWRLTGNPLQGALAAVLFAATPVVSEALCWMLLRGQWIGLGFALASCVVYLEYRWCAARHKPLWLGASVSLYAVALLAPPTYLSLPLWLVLFDLWDRRRDWRTLVIEKVPYLLLAAWSAYTLLSSPGARFADSQTETSHPLLLDLNLVIESVRTLLWPTATGLELPVTHPAGWLDISGHASIMTLGFAPLASLAVLATGGWLLITLKRQHRWSLPLLWGGVVLVSVLPTLSLLGRGGSGTFEYRDLLIAHVLSAILLADLARRLVRHAGRAKTRRYVTLGFVVLYLGWACSVTYASTAAWRSPAKYWQRMVDLYPGSYAPLYRAGKVAQQEKRHADAVDFLRRALKVNKARDLQIYRRLGESLYALGEFAGAKKYWRRYYTENPYEITAEMQRRFAKIGLELPTE